MQITIVCYRSYHTTPNQTKPNQTKLGLTGGAAGKTTIPILGVLKRPQALPEGSQEHLHVFSVDLDSLFSLLYRLRSPSGTLLTTATAWSIAAARWILQGVLWEQEVKLRY